MTMDREFETLQAISQRLEREDVSDNWGWKGSPFEWLESRPPATKGAVGKKMVSKWLSGHGYSISRTGDTEADRVVKGQRIQIKFSLLWEKGFYKFQQFRDQRYDFAICLGISPHTAHCWVIPKSDILALWAAGTIKTQHGGKSGSDTAWFSVKPNSPPEWLSDYGGTLSEGLVMIEGHGQDTPTPSP